MISTHATHWEALKRNTEAVGRARMENRLRQRCARLVSHDYRVTGIDQAVGVHIKTESRIGYVVTGLGPDLHRVTGVNEPVVVGVTEENSHRYGKVTSVRAVVDAKEIDCQPLRVADVGQVDGYLIAAHGRRSAERCRPTAARNNVGAGQRDRRSEGSHNLVVVGSSAKTAIFNSSGQQIDIECAGGAVGLPRNHAA